MILTLASFVAKILSAIYRVPYQNLVGDSGFYVYQQVYPIYGLGMTLALSGLPQFISKYTAEKDTPKAKRDALASLMPLLSGAGICLWGGTYFGSQLIAGWMGDSQLAPLIKIVSFTFLTMPALSILRGGFQGDFLMVPTAVSQVVEQFLRVGIIVLSALAFKSLGWDIYMTGTMAMTGALLGAVVGIMILLYYQHKLARGMYLTRRRERPTASLARRLVLEGGLMTVYSGLLILFQLVDSFTIKTGLTHFGLTEEAAKVAKGVYDRGQPLVQLGLVVALALSSSFLPLLTRYLATAQQPQFFRSSKIYLKMTAAISSAASLGLAFLMPYVNYTLFKDIAGNFTLVLFVFAIFFTAMIQSFQSIAQSQNRFRLSLKAAGWGLLVKAVATYFLTRLIGTTGASLATLAGLAVTLAYLYNVAEKPIRYFHREGGFGRKLFLSLIGMSGALAFYEICFNIFLQPLEHRWLSLLVCLGGVMIGGVAFLYLIVRLKVFTVREWLMVPFGKKILRMKK